MIGGALDAPVIIITINRQDGPVVGPAKGLRFAVQQQQKEDDEQKQNKNDKNPMNGETVYSSFAELSSTGGAFTPSGGRLYRRTMVPHDTA